MTNEQNETNHVNQNDISEIILWFRNDGMSRFYKNLESKMLEANSELDNLNKEKQAEISKLVTRYSVHRYEGSTSSRDANGSFSESTSFKIFADCEEEKNGTYEKQKDTKYRNSYDHYESAGFNIKKSDNGVIFQPSSKQMILRSKNFAMR